MLCGFAQTIGQLVAFRVLQGVGGGMLTPIGIAMLFRAFPPIERARASTIVMIPTLVAPALGPVLGGLHHRDARLALDLLRQRPVRHRRAGVRPALPPRAHRADGRAVRRPRASCSRASAWRRSPTPSTRAARRLDRARRGRARASSASSRSPLLVYVETHQPHPMLALRLLKLRLFRATNLVMAFAHGQLHRPDVRDAAVPAGPARARPAPQRPDDVPAGDRHPHLVADRRAHLPAGRAAPADHRRHARGRGGDGVPAVRRPRDRPLVDPRASCSCAGFAMGFCFVSSQAASYAEIAPADNGRASAIFSTQRQMSASIGVALMATVLASFTTLSATPSRPGAGAHRVPLDVRPVRRPGARSSALLAFLMIHDEDARETMLARRPPTRAGRRLPPTD